MIHVLIFRNVPCDVEPEIFGDAKCRKALLGDSMCDVVRTSGKPFYARLLPDSPDVRQRDTAGGLHGVPLHARQHAIDRSQA
jgi:hypothetical protein